MRVLQLKRRKNGRAIKHATHRLCFSADSAVLAASFGHTPGWAAIHVHCGAVPELPELSVGRPTCLAFSQSGEYLAFGCSDGRARPFRLADTRLLSELTPGIPFAGIADVAFAPNAEPKNQWLAVCGNEFWLWNALTQQYLVAPDQGQYRSTTFEPDSLAVVVATFNEVIRFTIRPFVETWRFRPAGVPQFVLASPEAERVAVLTDGFTMFQMNTEDGSEHSRTDLATRPRSAAFLPNSRLLAVADGSPTLRVYDTDTGTVAREYDWGIGGIHCVTFSNDGAMGAAGGDKGQVVVWDLE